MIFIYQFDVDGTICNLTTNHEYYKAEPYPEMVEKINKLYDQGHIIKIATARGQASGKEFFELTKKQLEIWGVKYHSLHKKEAAHFYVDDRGMTPDEFILGKDYDRWEMEKGSLQSAAQSSKPQDGNSSK